MPKSNIFNDLKLIVVGINDLIGSYGSIILLPDFNFEPEEMNQNLLNMNILRNLIKGKN